MSKHRDLPSVVQFHSHTEPFGQGREGAAPEEADMGGILPVPPGPELPGILRGKARPDRKAPSGGQGPGKPGEFETGAEKVLGHLMEGDQVEAAGPGRAVRGEKGIVIRDEIAPFA